MTNAKIITIKLFAAERRLHLSDHHQRNTKIAAEMFIVSKETTCEGVIAGY